jgi:hypothetical protein
MITNELIQYIEKSLAKGNSRSDIEAKLTSQGGWTLIDIDNAFKAITSSAGTATTAAQPPAPAPTPIAAVTATYATALQTASGMTTSTGQPASPLAPYESKFSPPQTSSTIQPSSSSHTGVIIAAICLLLVAGGGFYAWNHAKNTTIGSPINTNFTPNLIAPESPIEKTPILESTPANLSIGDEFRITEPEPNQAPEITPITDTISANITDPLLETPVTNETTTAIIKGSPTENQDPDTSAIIQLLESRSKVKLFRSEKSTYRGICDSDIITTIKSKGISLASCRSAVDAYSISINLSSGVFCVDASGAAKTQPTKALVPNCD